MLKKVVSLGCAAIAAVCLTATPASAAGGISYNVPLVEVLDITNEQYPSTYRIGVYDRTLPAYAQFTLEEAGTVRAYVNWDISETATSGNIWFARDAQGLNVVGDVKSIYSGSKDAYVYLEEGTYYCFLQWADACYSLGLALQFQSANSDEAYDVTSFERPNVLGSEPFSGFLTCNSPSDYYVFAVTERSLATFKYSFEEAISGQASTQGRLTIYDDNQAVIGSDTEGTAGQVKEYNVMLEPGTYYARLSGKYGRTSLDVDYTPYEVTLEAVSDDWVTDYVTVYVDTDVEVQDVIVYKGDVAERDLNNGVAWSDSKKRVTFDRSSMTFDADESGTYSVKVTDVYGNSAMNKISIGCVDKVGPTVSGVQDGEAYTQDLTITWRDSGIGTDYTTLNGKKVKSGVEVTDPGEYELLARDNLGNITEVHFCIDTKAPTISGVTNGKTYSGTQYVTLSDDISGIDRVVYNGNEMSYYNNGTLTLSGVGTHRVSVWDKAGNNRAISITIK